MQRARLWAVHHNGDGVALLHAAVDEGSDVLVVAGVRVTLHERIRLIGCTPPQNATRPASPNNVAGFIHNQLAAPRGLGLARAEISDSLRGLLSPFIRIGGLSLLSAWLPGDRISSAIGQEAIMKIMLTTIGAIIAAIVFWAAPISFDWSLKQGLSLSWDSAQARHRHHRHGYRRGRGVHRVYFSTGQGAAR